jgi:predicted secreted acid phosphatase
MNSAEYAIITEYLYRSAARSISTLEPPSEPWVVAMDVDETLLNNVEYNRRRDLLGLRYSSESWAEWVKEESATAVPGSIAFVTEVLNKGGQIVLITNRDRDLDPFTWNNLTTLEFPIDRSNTCIMGRSQADRDYVGDSEMINDKDLRRTQISMGTATYCWENYPETKERWNKPLSIVFEVGDNIKDFSQTTQENVDRLNFIDRVSSDVLLLPNAVYGSWE